MPHETSGPSVGIASVPRGLGSCPCTLSAALSQDLCDGFLERIRLHCCNLIQLDYTT